MPFAEVHRCTRGQSYEHTSLSTKRIRVRKRGRGRGKYVGRGKRTSMLLGTSRGSCKRGLGRRKGEEMERTKKRGWASSTYPNQCIRYTKGRRLTLDCGFNFRGVCPVNSSSLSHSKIARSRVAEYEICSADCPWIYPPFTIPWRDKFKEWRAKTNRDPGIFHLKP